MITKCSLRVALLALGVMGMSWGLHAQCVDMTTMDDGNKRFIHRDMGCTKTTVKIIGGTETTSREFGWLDPYLAPASHPRHTLMTSAGTDNLCKELSVLPPDHSTSIRMMNDGYQATDTAKGEWLAYNITIDAATPLLLIDYAAVIEDPKHTSVVNKYPDYGQPYCGFEVIDAKGNTLFPNYHYVNQPNTIEGWKNFKNADRGDISTYWKDWSVVALDLSEFVGQRVSLVLKNFDCGVSEASDAENIQLCFDRHEAHMYSYVSCAAKELVLYKNCEGEEDSTFITAPEGFSYKWYRKDDEKTTLSTDRILAIPSANEDVTYCCCLTNYVGSFVLEQVVDAPEVVVDDPEDVGFGQTFTWSRSGEKIVVTGDYEYEEPYSGDDTLSYSKSCAKTIYRIHVDVAQLDCPGTFSIKDTICGDARGFNVAFRYSMKIDNSKEEPDTIYPSVQEVKVDFSDNWNRQEGEQIVIDDVITLVKSGYEDITKAIKVNGIAMDSTFFVPMPYDSVYRDNGDGSGEWIYAAPRPDNYTMTLTVVNRCGQEETHQVPFTVFYPANVIYQRWNDVLAIHNERYNGGNLVRSVRWYRNGAQESALGKHGAYIRRSDLVSDIVPYWAEITRSDDGKTFCTCRFTPTQQNVAEKPVFPNTMTIAPRERNTRQLQVTSATSGQYSLIDLSGRLLQKGVYGEAYGSPDILIAPSVAQGTYILLFRSDEGDLRSSKLIVE